MQEKASLLQSSQQGQNSKSQLNLKCLKVTNPLFLGQIGPRINELSKRLDVAGITYETLYSYFVNTIQYGGELAEFWLAYDNDEPGAFAHWVIRGLPHVGTVSLDFTYSWNRHKEVFRGLVDEFIDFGIKHRCPLYEGNVISKRHMDYFKKIAEAKKLTFMEMPYRVFKAKR